MKVCETRETWGKRRDGVKLWGREMRGIGVRGNVERESEIERENKGRLSRGREGKLREV